MLAAAALGSLDGDLDGVLAGRGDALGLVGAVRDDLRALGAAHALDFVRHALLELGGALAHPPELGAGAPKLALQLQHGFDAREVEPLLGGHALDPAQPVDVLLRVEPGVLRRALRRDQAARLVHPQRLGMHLRELGRDRDHEDAAAAIEARRGRHPPCGPTWVPASVLLAGAHDRSSAAASPPDMLLSVLKHPMSHRLLSPPWRTHRAAGPRGGCGRSWRL